MTLDTLFKITCGLAGLGWLIIIFVSPFWRQWDRLILSLIIAILAVTYALLNFTNFQPDILKKFSTLEGIQSLFQTKALLLAAWEHFLAFDLLAALWMKKNAVKLGIGHGLLIIPVIFTCMLGPFGFLLYLIVRWAKIKHYLADNGT